MRAREQASRAMQESRRPKVNVTIASARWRAEPGVTAILHRAIAEAACATAVARGEVSVVLTDDAGIRKLNHAWRKRDQPTNVLSFPASPVAPAIGAQKGRGRDPDGPQIPHSWGDIVIAYETTDHEARVEQKLFQHHLAHLAVHGFLHLLGYDHQVTDEAEAMEALETAILARLDIPDPYAEA